MKYSYSRRALNKFQGTLLCPLSRQNKRKEPRPAVAENQQSPPSRGIARDFVEFLLHNEKWWLTPMIIVLLLMAVLVALSGTGPRHSSIRSTRETATVCSHHARPVSTSGPHRMSQPFSCGQRYAATRVSAGGEMEGVALREIGRVGRGRRRIAAQGADQVKRGDVLLGTEGRKPPLRVQGSIGGGSPPAPGVAARSARSRRPTVAAGSAR